MSKQQEHILIVFRRPPSPNTFGKVSSISSPVSGTTRSVLVTHRAEKNVIERKKHVSSLFGVDFDFQDGDIINIDTSTWRKTTWTELYNSVCVCPSQPPFIDISYIGGNVFFNNNAAHIAHLTYHNYNPGTSTFVLFHAHADACLRLPRGFSPSQTVRQGNKIFNSEMFYAASPKAPQSLAAFTAS